MKRLFIFFLLAAVACSRTDAPSLNVVLTADAGTASKAGLDTDGRTLWHADDKLSVFYQGSLENACAQYIGEDGAASGSFLLSLKEMPMGGPTVAVCPFREDNSLNGSVISTKIPDRQPFVDGSYGTSSPALVACAQNDNLTFRYACAVVALCLRTGSSAEVSVTDVKMKSAKGEAVAGALAVDISDPSTPLVSVVDGTDAVQMDFGVSPLKVGNGIEPVCCFCIAPGYLSGGYEFCVTYQDGAVQTVKCTGPVRLEAGKMYFVQACLTQKTGVVLDFSNRESFNPSIPSSATKTEGAVHSFKNPLDNAEYSLTASSPTGGYYWKKVNSKGCLRFNSPGDWLLLPAIGGKRLVRVGVTLQQSASKSFTLSSTPDSTGDIMPPTSFKPDEMQYVPVISQPGQKVYMNMTSNNMQISRIELEYE